MLGQTLWVSARVVLDSLLGRLTPETLDARLAPWCDAVFDASRTTLRVTGLEHVDPARPYVLIGNHQSLLDIPALVRTFPGRLRFVGKQELRRVPVFGEALERAGVVFVDRRDRSRAIAQLEGVRAHLEQGISVWVSAEGSRSRDGQLGTFKKGGFHVALGLGVPILPVWIQGTLQVLPPDQWASLSGQEVQVRYGRPIPTVGRQLADLLADTRSALEGLSASAAPG